MSFYSYTSPTQLSDVTELLYYQPAYLSAQNHANFIAYENDNFLIAFNISKSKAISIEKSPYGSFCQKNAAYKSNDFINEVLENLASRGIKTVTIKQPASIYTLGLPSHALHSFGFKPLYTDINHYIPLTNKEPLSMHQMQVRKLRALKRDGFHFRKMEPSELETAYKFLSACRQAQGLNINISWEVFKKLTDALPDRYSSFCVEREGKISALCICAHVTLKAAYYYLPATSPLFRSQSPMVLLIWGLASHYRSMGFDYLDLGASSIEGNVQETLKLFKERMGADTIEKVTLSCEL